MTAKLKVGLIWTLAGTGDSGWSGDGAAALATCLNEPKGLTLDAEGNPNAVFIFQIQGAFSTGAFSKIYLINGASAQNIFWKVEGAVTISNNSDIKGTIVCNNGAVVLNTGTTLEGRALALHASVTLVNTRINVPAP